MLRSQLDLTAPQDAVMYGRMSDDMQNPRSPDQQFATIHEGVQRQRRPWQVVADYRDDGISGRLVHKRPGLQEMLRDFRSGRLKAKLLLVDTFERLSRAEDAAEFRRKLLRMGVTVLTGDTGFVDPSTPAGRAMSFVEVIRSTEEGRIKGHNVLRGKKDACRQRQWPGGPPPFGYRLKNVMVMRNGIEEIAHRVLESDPAKAWILKLAFGLAYEHGWGTSRLAKALNANPQIPLEFKPFQAATIGTWLDSPIYYGTLIWGKNCTGIVDDVRVVQAIPEDEWERIEGFCEPLVDRDVWESVQHLRNERRQKLAESRTPEEVSRMDRLGIALKYPLTGLVRCAHCGRSMIPSGSGPYHGKDGRENRYVAYACPGYHSGACHNNRRIPEP